MLKHSSWRSVCACEKSREVFTNKILDKFESQASADAKPSNLDEEETAKASVHALRIYTKLFALLGNVESRSGLQDLWYEHYEDLYHQYHKTGATAMQVIFQ